MNRFKDIEKSLWKQCECQEKDIYQTKCIVENCHWRVDTKTSFLLCLYHTKFRDKYLTQVVVQSFGVRRLISE